MIKDTAQIIRVSGICKLNDKSKKRVSLPVLPSVFGCVCDVSRHMCWISHPHPLSWGPFHFNSTAAFMYVSPSIEAGLTKVTSFGTDPADYHSIVSNFSKEYNALFMSRYIDDVIVCPIFMSFSLLAFAAFYPICKLAFFSFVFCSLINKHQAIFLIS